MPGNGSQAGGLVSPGKFLVGLLQNLGSFKQQIFLRGNFTDHKPEDYPENKEHGCPEDQSLLDQGGVDFIPGIFERFTIETKFDKEPFVVVTNGNKQGQAFGV